MPETPPELDQLLRRGYRYALSLAHDRTTAEELLQDACLSVVKSRGPWNMGSLITSIRHRFIDRLRRRGLTMESIDADTFGALVESATADALDPALDEALRMLRPAEREMLYLSAVEGLSSGDIATATDRPRGTVLSLIHRAKRKVRERLIASGKPCGARNEENHEA